MWTPIETKPEHDGELVVRGVVHAGTEHQWSPVYTAIYEVASDTFLDSKTREPITVQLIGWRHFLKY